MNFILDQMTFVKYYIPLVLAGNKRGLNSTFYYKPKPAKYNCPIKNFKHLECLSKEYGFKIKPLGPEYLEGLSFFIESVSAEEVRSDKKISFTYMTDYILRTKKYPPYFDHIDHCIFPSKSFSRFAGLENHPKSLHLGSPKYDIDFDDQEISKKYNLSKKNALILFPRSEYVRSIDFGKIFKSLSDLDYKIFIKTRGKDPVNPQTYPDAVVLHDESWFPHPSLELLHSCDLMINFDSTGVKEAIMLDTPTINFNTKTRDRGFYGRLPYLVNESCVIHATDFNITDKLLEVESRDFTEDFKETRKKHLFERKGVCDNIISHFST